MNVFWIPVIAIAGSFFMVIAVVYLISASKQRMTRSRAEVQMKLIERFGNASEFVNFIQSPDGRHFLGDAPRVARNSFIGGIRSGIIMGFIGLGFVLISWTQHDRDFLIPAFILLGLGVGFFASSWISMKLAKDIDRSE